MRSETMSRGKQVDLNWAGTEVAQSGVAGPPASAPNTGAAYLTDEEILGIEPVGVSAPLHHAVIPSEARNLSSIDDAGRDAAQRDSSGKDGPRNDNTQTTAAGGAALSGPSEGRGGRGGGAKKGGGGERCWWRV